jgi:hypothetical protein
LLLFFSSSSSSLSSFYSPLFFSFFSFSSPPFRCSSLSSPFSSLSLFSSPPLLFLLFSSSSSFFSFPFSSTRPTRLLQFMKLHPFGSFSGPVSSARSDIVNTERNEYRVRIYTWSIGKVREVEEDEREREKDAWLCRS